MSKNPFPSDLEEIVLCLLEGLATPRAVTVAILLRHREFDQIAKLQCDPRTHICEESYRLAAIATSLLRKCADLPTSFDRKAVAVDTFFATERICHATNIRLAPFLEGALDDVRDEPIYRFLMNVRTRISRILGSPPEMLDGAFGPGGTFGDKGRLTTVADKMTSDPMFTTGSLSFLINWVGTAWATACADAGKRPVRVRGSRFTTVRKDCSTDRGIEIQPSITGFYQLGLGREVRKRLKSAGIDLVNGQHIHRRVVRECSLSGRLASLDLTNASSSSCKNLVRLLVRADWLELFEELRTTHTLINGHWVRLEMFSAMGNGYTFELETLIFHCICLEAVQMNSQGIRGFTSSDVFTYGDDILIPSQDFKAVVSALKFCGFTPNERKSFSEGDFRESCGADYFRGLDVRPFFLKEFPHEPHEFIKLANGISRLSRPSQDGRRREDPGPMDPRFLRAWFRTLESVPVHIRRLRGPEDLGDAVIHDRPHYWGVKWESGIRYIKTWSQTTDSYVGWNFFRPSVVIACALYGAGDGRLGILPRDPTISYVQRWVAYS